MKNLIILTVITLTPLAAFCEEEKKPQEVSETVVETEGMIQIGDAPFSYKAKAGTLTLKDEENKAKMNLFYVAYTKKEEEPTRPITFCFNGGPGSSAVWLHMGMFGPKRLDFNEDGTGVYSSQLIDNQETLLDLTDLVFIDPVSCGYSRATCSDEAKQFYGVEEDIKWISEFIRLYLTREKRWASPKYLAGESYGTARAAGLSEHLLSSHFIPVDGIVLLSTVLNFQTIRDPQSGNDLPYTLFLPTYTATAWYHNKLSKELQQQSLTSVLERVEIFALTDYSQALMLGDRLEPSKKRVIAKKLALYTGISQEIIEQNQLRVDWITFKKELIKGQFVGRFDSRVKNVANKDDSPYTDPSLYAFSGPFTTAINHYLLNDLKWEKDDPYRILANVYPWNWGQANNTYLNMSRSLVYTLSRNPNTRVFVGSGLYDLATPYFSTDYTFNHLGLNEELKNQITMKTYLGGHMPYTNKQTREQIKKDLTAFYEY